MKISKELQNTLRQLGKLKEFSKKSTLLAEGEISRQAYFIESGSIRLWYNNDGEDISVKFFLPGDLCASLESLHHEEPSRYELETLTPCVVHVIDKAAIDSKANHSPHLKEYLTSVMVHCMSNYKDLFVDRIAQSPEQRYKSLVDQDPELLDHVPLHYVASYLGITPVLLSRIRKRFEPLNNC